MDNNFIDSCDYLEEEPIVLNRCDLLNRDSFAADNICAMHDLLKNTIGEKLPCQLKFLKVFLVLNDLFVADYVIDCLAVIWANNFVSEFKTYCLDYCEITFLAKSNIDVDKTLCTILPGVYYV